MTETRKLLSAKLDLVTKSPGVYLMKDTAGSIIYVGKAVDLHSRLRSYFTSRPQGSAKVLAMISRITDFETIVCANEVEALMLESTLIKKHQPMYNILLRDDKDYPYIKVTLNEEYPRVLKAFRIGEDRKQGARYYGPYLAGDIKQALGVLRDIFPTKTCRRVFPRDIGKERPCLNYYIGKCIGPCKGDVPAAAYREVMENICRFLEGRYDVLLGDLKKNMQEAADNLHYELAALQRDRIQILEKLVGRQKVVSNRREDKDIISTARNGSEFCLQKLEVRDGRVVAAAAFFLPDSEQSEEEVLQAYISQHYPEIAHIPVKIIVPVLPWESESLAELLGRLAGRKIDIMLPRRGINRELLEMARKNAAASLQRHTLLGGNNYTSSREALRLLAQLVAPGNLLQRIEAIDISQTGEQDRTASLVVFQEGRPARQQYRRFRLNQGAGIDDYAAIREVLRRRLLRLQDSDFGTSPDLILVDGGKGQVSSARQILQEMNLDIPLAGMVKDDRHRTRGLVTPEGRIIELRPDNLADLQDSSAFSLADSADSASDTEYSLELRQRILLRFITAVQEEAHRFAGAYRSKLHKKRTMRFSLEDIPGVGPARRKILLQKFQSVKNIAAASQLELAAIPGLNENVAAAVYKHFHPEDEL